MASFLFILAGCLVIFTLILGILIHSYLAVVTVENVSMSPTLEHGDRVLAMRRCPIAWLRKGHIVLVWPSRTSSSGPTLFEVKPYIKRIIGLGEETLTVSLHEEAGTADPQRYKQLWHIPQGYIFVCGDNPAGSLDSRTWGPIPLQSVLGVVIMKLPRKSLPYSLSGPPPETGIPSIGLPMGQTAPPFAAQTLSDETVTLTSYSGQAIIFLFIAPADHCRKAVSVCTNLAPRASRAGITMVFVSATGIQPTRPFADELHISIPILVAPRASNSFLNDYNISGTPAYCFINKQGKVQSSGFLSMRWGEWKSLVDSWGGHEPSIPDDLY